MAFDSRIYYWFNGSSGCSRCSAMTGYYDTVPARPHPNCKCPIRAIVGIGTWEVFYQNKQEYIAATTSEEVRILEHTNISKTTKTFVFNVRKTLEGSTMVSAEIDKLFSASSKWSDVSTKSESIEVELNPGGSVTITALCFHLYINLEVERWRRHSSLGVTDREVFDETIREQIDVPRVVSFNTTVTSG